jgi:hypothetical protein
VPVEPREAVRVLGKVPGHPVEDDADAGGWQASDEQLEIFRRAEARGRREEPEHLIPHEPENGCSITGSSSRCVKPISLT